jgi:hypothetical protein
MSLDPQPRTAESSQDDVLLTRAEASACLATMGIQLKPASLARLWSTGTNGPPCRHIRSKPHYPLRLLREWAASQITDVRTGAPSAAQRRLCAETGQAGRPALGGDSLKRPDEKRPGSVDIKTRDQNNQFRQ